jgi:hypothetical protein
MAGTTRSEFGLVRVQEVRWDSVALIPQANYEVKNEICRACSMHGGEEECLQCSGGKAGGEEIARNTSDVGWRITLKWILEK